MAEVCSVSGTAGVGGWGRVTTLLKAIKESGTLGDGIWDGFLWLKRSLVVEVGAGLCRQHDARVLEGSSKGGIRYLRTRGSRKGEEERSKRLS